MNLLVTAKDAKFEYRVHKEIHKGPFFAHLANINSAIFAVSIT